MRRRHESTTTTHSEDRSIVGLNWRRPESLLQHLFDLWRQESRLLCCLLCIAFWPAGSGSTPADEVPIQQVAPRRQPVQQSWHQKYKWKAEDYFDDAAMIEMCRAIEANDLQQMDQLIASGIDVNAKGKDNMTLLLWAFPDGKVERFRKLLEAGADPNVVIQSDFGALHAIDKGDSVTLAAARYSMPDHFQLVMQHGGNPNQLHEQFGTTPLLSVLNQPMILKEDRRDRVRILIAKNADLNMGSPEGRLPIAAACLSGRFDIALELLAAGADPGAYNERSGMKLTHLLVRLEDDKMRELARLFRDDFDKLVAWLNEHGESYAEARKDLELHRESLERGENYLLMKRRQELARLKEQREQKEDSEQGKDTEPRC